MGKNRKNIDDLFKEELGNYAETPPPAVWDALDKRLEVAKPSGFTSSRWARYFFIGSAAVVLGLSVLKISGKLTMGKSIAPIADNIALKQNNVPITAPENNSINTANSTNISSILPTSSTPSTTSKPSSGTNAAIVQATSAGQSVSSSNNNNFIPVSHQLNGKTISDNTNNSVTGNSTNVATSKTKQYNTRMVGRYLYQEVKRTRIIAAKGNAATDVKNSKVVNSISAGEQIEGTTNNVVPKSKRHQHQVTGSSLAGASNEGIKNAMASNTDANTNSINKYGNRVTKNYNVESMPYRVLEATPFSATFKEEAYDPITTAIANAALIGVHVPKVRKYEVGVKAGYEGGIASSAGKKMVISPYVSYKIADRFEVMLQPSVKFAHIQPQQLKGTQTFYKENKDSSVSVTSSPVFLVGTTDTIGFIDKYSFSQSHDSIIKSYTSGGTYMEFELPVLLKYKLIKNLSVYGGFTVTYSKYLGTKENTNTQSIVRTADSSIYREAGTVSYAPSVASTLTYNGIPISGYKAPLYTTPQGGLFRMGYMLGFSYDYSNRWLLDLLVQQSAAKSSVSGGYNTNTPFAVPYFRVTLGYKILR